MEVKREILEKLKCSVCHEYLSCGPVMLLDNGDSVCGRCPINEGQFAARMQPYEDLAEQIIFPCRNEKKGCAEKVLFHELKIHEAGCIYRRFQCFISEPVECRWSGKIAKFHRHCKQNHPRNLLDNSVGFKYDLTKSSVCIFIMQAFDLLFSIKLKICAVSRKIYHSINFLVNPVMPATYNYEFVVLNKNNKVSIGGDLVAQEEYQENDGRFLTMSSIAEIFGGLDGTQFSFTVNESIQCTNCKVPMTRDVAHAFKKHWYCITCEDYECKYQPLGCEIQIL